MSRIDEIKYDLTNVKEPQTVVKSLDVFAKRCHSEVHNLKLINNIKKDLFELINSKNQLLFDEEEIQFSLDKFWKELIHTWGEAWVCTVFNNRECSGPNPIAGEIPLAEIYTSTLGILEDPPVEQPEEKDLLKWKGKIPKLTKKKFFLVAYKSRSFPDGLVLMIYWDADNNPEYLSCDMEKFYELYGTRFPDNICFESHEEAIGAFWKTCKIPACWNTLEGFWDNPNLVAAFGIRHGYSIHRTSE